MLQHVLDESIVNFIIIKLRTRNLGHVDFEMQLDGWLLLNQGRCNCQSGDAARECSGGSRQIAWRGASRRLRGGDNGQ